MFSQSILARRFEQPIVSPPWTVANDMGVVDFDSQRLIYPAIGEGYDIVADRTRFQSSGPR
jgi:hypothetical protein